MNEALQLYISSFKLHRLDLEGNKSWQQAVNSFLDFKALKSYIILKLVLYMAHIHIGLSTHRYSTWVVHRPWK